jgi:hypothetical protein
LNKKVEQAVSDPRSLPSIFREVFLGRQRFFVIAALVLILVSIALEYHSLSSHLNDTQEERLAAQLLPFWFSAHFYATALREVGFAFLIALVVTALLEQSSYLEQTRYFKEAINQLGQDHKKAYDEISENVFLSVLRSRVPSRISDIALDILISQRLIRKNVFIKYVINELPEEKAAFKERFLSVQGTIRYTLENITQEDVSIGIRAFIPFPADQRLNDIVVMNTVEIAGTSLTSDEIAAGSERIADSTTEKKWEWPTTIQAGKSIDVALNYNLVKERSDNDCWTSLYPTTNGQYEVNVNVGGLEWSVDALHSGSLLPADGSSPGVRVGGTCVFNFEKALLPFQGVLLWWRPKQEPIPPSDNPAGK